MKGYRIFLRHCNTSWKGFSSENLILIKVIIKTHKSPQSLAITVRPSFFSTKLSNPLFKSAPVSFKTAGLNLLCIVNDLSVALPFHVKIIIIAHQATIIKMYFPIRSSAEVSYFPWLEINSENMVSFCLFHLFETKKI